MPPTCKPKDVISASGNVSRQKMQDIKVSQCVRTLMDDSQRTDMIGFPSCQAFMNAVAPVLQDDLGGCSQSRLRDECGKIRSAFTVDVATDYCRAMVDANDTFWAKM